MATKLYVGNLPFNTTENELQELFSQAGAVQEVMLMQDKFTGKSRGFAFVTMGAGALQGLSFAFMWFVSMYQLWFSGTPEAVERRHGLDEIKVG